VTLDLTTDDPVWYVAYASNLRAERLRCYLAGGRPHGAMRSYEGCRDPSPPTGDRLLVLPGGLVFAGCSSVWGGAMAFYDPAADSQVVARSYRITFGQLSDLVSQESRHPVGRNLTPPREVGRPWPTPSGIYESVVHLGARDGSPMFTLTSLRRLEPAAPSAPYLRTILHGLEEVWECTADDRAAYVLQARGVTPTWSREQLLTLCAEHRPTGLRRKHGTPTRGGGRVPGGPSSGR
jgi:hypothetical protein